MQSITQTGNTTYCNVLETYDAAKCAYVNTPRITNLIDISAVIAESDFLYSEGSLGGIEPVPPQ